MCSNIFPGLCQEKLHQIELNRPRRLHSRFCNSRERSNSALNTAGTTGDLQPAGRVSESMDGKLLRGV